MGLVSKKDFGIALNISGGTIRSRISRGKLCCNKKGLIDTEHPTNYSYLVEVNGGDQSVFEPYLVSTRTKVVKKTNNATNIIRKNNNKVDVINSDTKNNTKNIKNSDFKKHSDNKGSVNIAPTVETKKKNIKLTAEERSEILRNKRYNDSILAFDIRKREAEVILKEREAELKQYELEKKAGNTLPLDQVVTMMSINYKAIFKSFHSQLKNIASTVVQNLGGSKDDLNSIMIEMEQHLNHIVKLSKEKSKVEIDKIIEEYSEVRSRGERKA